MSDVSSTLLLRPTDEVDGAAVVERLGRALSGQSAQRREQTSNTRRPSPGEGLALVAAFMEIEEPDLRQALLDAAALLASKKSTRL